MIKKISAVAAAAVIAATMSISAFAATYQDAVSTAKTAGVPANNVQELSNFLEANKDQFSSADYDDMIKTCNEVSEKYIAPLAKSMFDKTPADLTEDEKTQIKGALSEADKKAITDTVVALGKKYGVTITIKDGSISASMNKKTDNSSKASGTTTKSDNPVAATGAESESSNAAAAAAAVALAMAGFGVAVVAKKNRA